MSQYDDWEICRGCKHATFYNCERCLKDCAINSEHKRDRLSGECPDYEKEIRKFCPTCKHNIRMSEADLYCASKAYGSGKVFDWCEVYHEPVDRILELEPELDDCEEWEVRDELNC